MPSLPRAILFDLDDTLIRAYAQPEEAWTRLLHVFAAHLDAHDPAALERVRVAVMEEARAFWNDRAEAAKWRLNIPGARAALGAARPGQARLRATRRWPTASPTPSPNCAVPEYRLYPDAHATVDAPARRAASGSRW